MLTTGRETRTLRWSLGCVRSMMAVMDPTMYLGRFPSPSYFTLAF